MQSTGSVSSIFARIQVDKQAFLNVLRLWSEAINTLKATVLQRLNSTWRRSSYPDVESGK